MAQWLQGVKTVIIQFCTHCMQNWVSAMKLQKNPCNSKASGETTTNKHIVSTVW